MERHGGRMLVASPAGAITCRTLSALEPRNGVQGGGESVHELQCWCGQRRWQRPRRVPTSGVWPWASAS